LLDVAASMGQQKEALDTFMRVRSIQRNLLESLLERLDGLEFHGSMRSPFQFDRAAAGRARSGHIHDYEFSVSNVPRRVCAECV
jgi:hypothetical protein